MKVLYINRGYPGLGRVMGSVALHSIFETSPLMQGYQGIFASYLSGYTYLEKSKYHPINLFPKEYYYRPNAFCIPFGEEGRSVVKAIQSFSPDLIIVDGEPLFIDWLYDLLHIPILVLTNPSDLYNPSCDDMAIDLFRYYYSKAHLVIAHGIWRLPGHLCELGDRAGNVFEMNTIIHQAIYETSLQRRLGTNDLPSGRKVVGVLGGGSENVSPSYRSNSLQLANWLIDSCTALGVEKLTLYCPDSQVHQYLIKRPTTGFSLKLIADQVDNTADLIDADLIVGRAGRNLVSEVLALGTRSLLVAITAEKYRTGDQKETAEAALKASSTIRRISINDGYSAFLNSFQELIDLPPAKPVWVPGNETFVNSLPQILTRLTLHP